MFSRRPAGTDKLMTEETCATVATEDMEAASLCGRASTDVHEKSLRGTQ